MLRKEYEGAAGWYVAIAMSLLFVSPVVGHAQDSGSAETTGGYSVTESDVHPASEAPPQAASQPAATPADGPVRMVRFSFVQGDVVWRGDAGADWSQATVNLPLRQGAQVSVPHHSRAELQFDDGSLLRLGAGALLTFKTLYSDADGEFTQLELTEGLSSLRLKSSVSIYQIDTPYVSTKAVGSASYRVGVRDSVEVAVKAGTASVEGQQGKIDVTQGQFVEVPDSTTPFALAAIPADDHWEQWNNERDLLFAGSPELAQNLPANIYVVAPDLDAYGSWQTVPTYGAVWCPRQPRDWRPYSAGSWVWVNPFGWTWVGAEPWGWAPYHYGSWIHEGFGWAWVPGPRRQYWSPAVVTFTAFAGGTAWAPLCPEEIHYSPGLSLGFRHGDWSLFFSIGGCGVYYPRPDHICEVHPWSPVLVNRTPIAGGLAQLTDNRNSLAGDVWIPRNARFGGATMVNGNGLVGEGGYTAVPSTNLAAFQQGHPIIAPPAGSAPAAGPPGVRPTAAALTPTRTFNHLVRPQPAVDRPIYSAPVSPQTIRNAPASARRDTAFAPQVPAQAPASSAAVRSPRGGDAGTEDAVLRARSSLGLPARITRVDGTVLDRASGSSGVGSSASPANVPMRATTAAVRTTISPAAPVIRQHYGVHEIDSAPRRAVSPPPSGGGGRPSGGAAPGGGAAGGRGR